MAKMFVSFEPPVGLGIPSWGKLKTACWIPPESYFQRILLGYVAENMQQRQTKRK
jgi:hypothetical protein